MIHASLNTEERFLTEIRLGSNLLLGHIIYSVVIKLVYVLMT